MAGLGQNMGYGSSRGIIQRVRRTLGRHREGWVIAPMSKVSYAGTCVKIQETAIYEFAFAQSSLNLFMPISVSG